MEWPRIEIGHGLVIVINGIGIDSSAQESLQYGQHERYRRSSIIGALPT